MIVTFFLPAIVLWLWKTAKRQGKLEARQGKVEDRQKDHERRCEYDLAQIGEKIGTEKGKELAPKLRKMREENNG